MPAVSTDPGAGAHEPAGAPAAAGSAVDWTIPGRHGSPAEALARIQALCQGHPDLFGAMLVVLATHPGVAREHLATALRQFRPELAALTPADVMALLNAIWNGGWQGFDAVLRSRQRGERRGAALGWVKD